MTDPKSPELDHARQLLPVLHPCEDFKAYLSRHGLQKNSPSEFERLRQLLEEYAQGVQAQPVAYVEALVAQLTRKHAEKAEEQDKINADLTLKHADLTLKHEKQDKIIADLTSKFESKFEEQAKSIADLTTLISAIAVVSNAPRGLSTAL
ncbi:hypothetical protein M885DRAFT_561470 [Pelagophyceae sp. CCMP2097]|nr:hypothetical protein M885DRAFT_561470 [Pelagophyceae sp. CCMP2097]